MNNWPYKTIDENMYKMHELMGIHAQIMPTFNRSCECGLRFISSDHLSKDEELSLIENLAIGNPWYLNLNDIQVRYVANQLRTIKYPFHLPIHQSLGMYMVALNYLHGIKKCDAMTLAMTFVHHMDLFKGLLFNWGIYKSGVKDEILKTWEIDGDYLLEALKI
jgi:hypothetical protein